MSFKDIELRDPDSFTIQSLEIGITPECNIKCRHCGAYNEDRNSFMSASKIIDIISELTALKRIKLSGGEVTLYLDECIKIIEYCKARNIETQLNTNGSVLNKSRIIFLDKAGLDLIHVSLNFYDRNQFEKYYKMRAVNFDIIIDNIKACLDSKITTIVETLIVDENFKIIPELCDFLYKLGLRKHQIQTPVNQDDWKHNITLDIIKNLIHNLLKWKPCDYEFYFTCFSINRNGHFYKTNQNLIENAGVFFPRCIEGINQLHLHSNGDLVICDIGNKQKVGNIFNGINLATIMTDRKEFLQHAINYCCAINI
jgi:MoaA/NifB/PqqE/SkfB family radical SAM enzyme